MKLKNLVKLALIATRGKVGRKRGAYDEHKTVITILRDHSSRDSSWGRHSRAALTRMEVRDFPQKYVDTHLDVNKEGYLVIKVTNPNTIPLDSIRLRLTYKAPGNRSKTKYQPLGRVLDCGQSVRIQMDIGPIESSMELKRFSVEAVSAQPVN